MESSLAVPASTLISLLYGELKKLAASMMVRERVGHTLTATALVHEGYLRLAGERHLWDTRAQFFVAAAEAMRRVLINHAKRRKTKKRGGGVAPLSLAVLDLAAPASCDEGLAIEPLLDRLKQVDPKGHEVVMLHFFAGLTLTQAAAVLDVADKTAKRRWGRARLWLLGRLRGAEGPPKAGTRGSE